MKVWHWIVARVSILVLMLLVAAEASAQLGGIRGRVVDEDGNPLQAVKIAIELVGGGRSFNTESDAEGNYMRAGIRPGTYEVIYSLEGFEKGRANVKINAGSPMEMGNTTLTKLPEGVLGEEAHARATAALDKATAASSQGDYQATIDQLKKFLEEVPDSAEAYFNIGAAYEQMGNIDSAFENYLKATELNPEMYDAWVAVGDIYKTKQMWQEGMDALKHALDIRPNEILVRFNYGAYALNAGNMEVAEEAFETLVKNNPDHAVSHYQLGLVKIGMGKNEEGIAHLEKYIELEPEGANVPTAKELLNTLKQGS